MITYSHHQLTITQLWFSSTVLNTIGMLDKFLRERGKHIIAVMFRTIDIKKLWFNYIFVPIDNYTTVS